jgi:Fe-S cluster assembly scaffold protein SufB
MGQFERTLIIVDEDAYVHYVEGCTAPIYSSDPYTVRLLKLSLRKMPVVDTQQFKTGLTTFITW